MTEKAPRRPRAARARGFGFIPDEAEHHFLVTLGGQSRPNVAISEHMTWREDEVAPPPNGRDDAWLRVVLDRHKWDRIADFVRVTFNRRLKQVGFPLGQWRGKTVALSRPLGKELVLLAWAVEDADPGLIPEALENWRGLQPEERWWLYTMTAAATGHFHLGKNRGWRKAVRFALTENPVTHRPAANDDEAFKLVADDMSEVSAVRRPRTRAGEKKQNAG